MIELNAITKRFGNNTILDHLQLRIPEGSVFGLIGPNGAGKSTLLKMMSGIMECDEGSITYDGVGVYENPMMKQDILLVSDDPYYFYHATIKDMKDFYQLWYPRFNQQVYRKYLEIFQLDEKKPITTFSKGMKRQAFLAIALAIAPKYLFLDEAFDGLDPIMRLTFKRAITKFIEEKQMTVIISSHNLREMEDICDQFGILENHAITTSGDIYETKENIHKIQLAFSTVCQEDMFQDFDVLSLKIQSKVVNMVVKGNIEEIKERLRSMQPLMMEVLPVNLEEIFIYEMERKGYGVYE